MALLCLLAAPRAVEARIVRIEIVSTQSPTFGGREFGAVGRYEKIVARAFGELDPSDRRARLIADLDKAPKNARGRVEYSVDLHILKPIDMTRGNRRIFYDVVNRGNKRLITFNDAGPNDLITDADAGSGLMMRLGYTLVFSGWEDEQLVAPGNGRTGAAPSGAQP